MYHLGLKKGEKNEKRVIKGSKLNDRLTGNLEGLNTSGSFCKVGSWCIDLASMLMFHPFLILNPISVLYYELFFLSIYTKYIGMHRKFMYIGTFNHTVLECYSGQPLYHRCLPQRFFYNLFVSVKTQFYSDK